MENKKLNLVIDIIDQIESNAYYSQTMDSVLQDLQELKQILLEEDGDQTWLFKFPNGDKYEIELDYDMGVGVKTSDVFWFKIIKDGELLGQELTLNLAIVKIIDIEDKFIEEYGKLLGERLSQLEEDTYKNASENMEV